MADLIEVLWEPFLCSDGDGIVIDVTYKGGLWALESSDGDKSDSPNPWRVVDHLRHVIIDRALSDTEPLVVLHAAVVTKGDSCVVLAGPSGAGKTTLALALLEEGWSYLSDDAAPFDPASGRVIPFPKPLNLRDAATWEGLRERWSPPSWPAEPIGGLPIPASAFSRREGSGSIPTHLVFSSYLPGSPGRLESLSAGEALARCGEMVRRLDPITLSHLSALCQKADRAELWYEDTEQAVQLLVNWLFKSGP